MNPNSVLSEKLRVKKLLTGDEKVVFKLINAFKKEIGREGNSVPEVYAFSKMKDVIDPWGGPNGTPKTVVIGNVIANEPFELPDGRMMMKPVCKPVEFIRGFLTLGADRNATLEYVMRRPDCQDNPYWKAMGGKAGGHKFKMVNDKKEINEQLHVEELRWQAETLIRTARDPLVVKAIAEKLNQSQDERLHVLSYAPSVGREDFTQIKLELIQKVKLYPKQVIYASGDKKAMTKVEALEAINFGVLSYTDGAYMLIGKKNIEPIFTPGPDEDRVDALIEHLLSEDGRKDYAKVAVELKNALQPVG